MLRPPDDTEADRYLRRVVAELLALYRAAQDDIMERLANPALTEAGERRMRSVLREVSGIVATLDAAVVDFSNRSTTNALRYGARATLEELERLGIKTKAFDIAAYNPAVRVIAEAMAGDMLEANASINATARRVLRPSQIRAVTDRTMTQQIGRGVILGETRRDTSRRLANEIRERLGDGQLVQAGARRYKPEKYAELVARTRTREAVVEGAIAGAIEYEIDLFQVSVHDGPCDQCKAFQGKIYSLSGSHPDFPTLERRPPFHPHCKHILLPIVERVLKRRGQYDALAEFSRSERTVGDYGEYAALAPRGGRVAPSPPPAAVNISTADGHRQAKGVARKALTPKQAEALDLYTGTEEVGSAFGDINQYVRTGNATKISERKRERVVGAAEELKAYFEAPSIRLEADTTLYRGVQSNKEWSTWAADLHSGVSSGSIVGTTIRDKGFLSTSADIDTASRFAQIGGYRGSTFGVRMEIKAKAGTPILYGTDGEREIVLGPDARLRVVGVRPLGPEEWVVQAELEE